MVPSFKSCAGSSTGALTNTPTGKMLSSSSSRRAFNCSTVTFLLLFGNSTMNPAKSGLAWFTAWISSGRVRPQILILVLLPCFNGCSLIFSQSCPFCLPLPLPVSLLFAAGQLCYLFALFFRLAFIQALHHSDFPMQLSYPGFASGSHRSGLHLPGFFPG